MMIVPRSFAQKPVAHKHQSPDVHEKTTLCRRRSSEGHPRTPQKPAFPRDSSSQRPTNTSNASGSSPVRIPSRAEKRASPALQRPGPTALQGSSSPSPNQVVAKRRDSAQNILASTTIPVRRKPRQRPSQRLPNCDYVSDFSKLLREDVPPITGGSFSSSWTNPQFEGLFGAIDGLMEGQMIVGSEGLDAGILSTRSLSSESMPSLASPDDYSSSDLQSISPATVRSPSESRLRQTASSEDCSNQHPLLPEDDDEPASGASTPGLIISPPPTRRRPITQPKQSNSFKSSLTASLRALKSAAQTVSNIATTHPVLPPDELMTGSFFDFKPELTDDRRPPPSDDPPSAALRRYLNPHVNVPADSPAQLHFWVEEKALPSSKSTSDSSPKLKTKTRRKTKGKDQKVRIKGTKGSRSQLPPIVQLATCIPSAVRTANASSPPTWLGPDGTPSNSHRAAQTLLAETVAMRVDEPTRQREPRENRDFLRVFVCEMNMRKSGKLSDEAVGHARLWLPPVVDREKDKQMQRTTVVASARWSSWTMDDV